MAEALQSGVPNDKKRKRPRAARACQFCRSKKYRCDELFPCSQCKRQKQNCVYDVADHVRQRMLNSGDLSESRSTEHCGGESGGNSAAISGRDSHLPMEAFSTAASNGAVTPTSPPSTFNPLPQTYSTPIGSTLDVQREEITASVHQAGDGQDIEVSDVNPHTQSLEFHGQTSSIAFLATLRPQAPKPGRNGNFTTSTTSQHPSLLSNLHNEAFSPEFLVQGNQEGELLEAERYYFRQAQVFLDGYFQNIHFVHPILDRREFMNRCEDLWFGTPDQQPKSFVALYYSIMSLGCLIRTWDEVKFDGLGRHEWSRKLFSLARVALGTLKSMTSVESIQCLFFMAKVCQNELNPSLAYMYLGWATRASFSAGFNRKRVSGSEESFEKDEAISKLWWGLYSLEIETSFALGRPDSLGADAYHNQLMPLLDETETAIITAMVQFAKIIKEVSISIYLSENSIQGKAEKASQLENKMDSWLQNLPTTIRPSIFETFKMPKIGKDQIWASRQRLVLELRFHNVKMVLFRPFLTAAAIGKQNPSTQMQEAMNKCVDAARSTIKLMHEMYCHHIFFRTWWYNTTYILYAASIVLCYGTKVASSNERQEFLDLGGQTIEILEAMGESVVAKNASQMIKQIISSANELPMTVSRKETNGNSRCHGYLAQKSSVPDATLFVDDSFQSFLDLDQNAHFLSMTFPLNGNHFTFWNDMEHLAGTV